MKKIVIITDTHGFSLEAILPIMQENDLILFSGDGYNALSAQLPKELLSKTIAVGGNCDSSSLPQERLIDVEDVTIFLTHGHRYAVRDGYKVLATAAKSLGAQLAVFGHTHVPCLTEECGVKLFNAGSYCAYNGALQYGYLIVCGDKFFLSHVEL